MSEFKTVQLKDIALLPSLESAIDELIFQFPTLPTLLHNAEVAPIVVETTATHIITGQAALAIAKKRNIPDITCIRIKKIAPQALIKRSWGALLGDSLIYAGLDIPVLNFIFSQPPKWRIERGLIRPDGKAVSVRYAAQKLGLPTSTLQSRISKFEKKWKKITNR
ncbi:hypothetical protein [Agarivorans litoreus]|uniref:hypothetical protein n=1 Tax=Agarivorans litoreus TaxID=1510455 RepID=UPI001C7D93F3|nr:hypothetical protein [Agarivorans litoreus]